MKILFDQGVPVPLRRHLPEHQVDTAYEQGWAELRNGALLDRAEEEGYHLMVTTDQNLRDQQNLERRELAIVVLLAASWPRLQQHADIFVPPSNRPNQARTLKWRSDSALQRFAAHLARISHRTEKRLGFPEL